MIAEILKKKINTCGKTRYQINQETGIDQAVLSRFINGKKLISLDTADTLLKYFDLEIRDKKPKKKGGKR